MQNSPPFSTTLISPMPTRQRSDSYSQYKFGFNGKEKDNEINVNGGDYPMAIGIRARIYASRLGRCLSLNPLAIKYPFISSYHFANNNPILFTDFNGFDGIQPRDVFYQKMGTTIINTLNYLDIGDKANTFKALYLICQYRMENKFNLAPSGNNPFNIKGVGDLGEITLKTPKYLNGKRVVIKQKFANFSNLEKGFEGYMQLLKKNYSTAYDKLFDNTNTVIDFAKSMQTEGRLGVFATDPEYQLNLI